MKLSVATTIGLCALVACSRDKAPEQVGTTTTTGATVGTGVSVDEVRTKLLEASPGSPRTIEDLIVTNDNGVITLQGRVENEETRRAMVSGVREMPNVRRVRDELRVASERMVPSDAKGLRDLRGTRAQ